jgi:ribonucleotide monophosphatase NagD (HAD superfamily)
MRLPSPSSTALRLPRASYAYVVVAPLSVLVCSSPVGAQVNVAAALGQEAVSRVVRRVGVAVVVQRGHAVAVEVVVVGLAQKAVFVDGSQAVELVVFVAEDARAARGGLGLLCDPA